jgi:hypothetical protein
MTVSYEKMSKELGGALRDTLRFTDNWRVDDAHFGIRGGGKFRQHARHRERIRHPES